MPPNPKNIIIHELIGREVVVINHTDPTLIGIRGIVVNETLKTIHVLTKDGVKVVSKKNGTFCFHIEGRRWTIVRGDEIFLRPHERTKRGYKRYLRRRPLTFKDWEDCMKRYLQKQ